MKFLLETDRSTKDTAIGEMSYTVREIDIDGIKVPQVNLLLAINKFYTEISKVTCEIGVFEEVKLISISGGTKDPATVYELVTSKFSLNPDRIDTMMAELEQTI